MDATGQIFQRSKFPDTLSFLLFLKMFWRLGTLRHYTRASLELVDVKACWKIICNIRFEREIKLVRL